jgi:hypothetical protein
MIADLYRERLTRRNAALRRYLTLLTLQSAAIERNDAAGIIATLPHEREILAEVTEYARATATIAREIPPARIDEERAHLEVEGARLAESVRSALAANRTAIEKIMGEIDERLGSVAVPRRARSVFRAERYGGSMIDMEL